MKFFNFRWSGIAAGGAFIISLLLGLLSGPRFLILLRAGIFAGIFFIMASLIHWLIQRFLPDLMPPSPSEEVFAADDMTGSQVDITVEGEEADLSLPGRDQEREDSGFPLDQPREDDYTTEGGEGKAEDSGGVPPVAVPKDEFDTMDLLPDMETDGTNQDFEADEEEAPMPSRARSSIGGSGNSPGLNNLRSGGDFQPKDIASAIQTILKRDEG